MPENKYKYDIFLQMDGCLVILHPFQQYVSNIRTSGGENKMLCAMEPHLGLKRFPSPGIKHARSAGQCLTHRAAGAHHIFLKRDVFLNQVEVLDQICVDAVFLLTLTSVS